MKKIFALLVTCVFFSGTSYDNQASIIPVPTETKDTVRIQEMDEKVQELDSLLIQLKEYETKK